MVMCRLASGVDETAQWMGYVPWNGWMMASDQQCIWPSTPCRSRECWRGCRPWKQLETPPRCARRWPYWLKAGGTHSTCLACCTSEKWILLFAAIYCMHSAPLSKSSVVYVIIPLALVFALLLERHRTVFIYIFCG